MRQQREESPYRWQFLISLGTPQVGPTGDMVVGLVTPQLPTLLN